MLLETIRKCKRRAFTFTNLIEDFGHSSVDAINLLNALGEGIAIHLAKKENNKIRMLYEEWKTLFGQASGLSSTQIKSIGKTINFKVNTNEKEKIPALLFVIHTYNSLIMKLLAAEILAEHNLTSFKDFASTVALLDNSSLKKYLIEEVERGKLFDSAGIIGFVEETVFSWYLDADNISYVLDTLKILLVRLSLFRIGILKYENTGDILKRFYQNLVPEALRKSLGEFYTPDWMIKYFYDRIEDSNLPNLRILDPTCGSGSFLMEAILRRKRRNKKIGKSIKETLDDILENIWGFDLNPLAVQTARVNYLISISDLLKEIPGTRIEIPILLADAVYSPASNPSGESKVVEYTIGSEVANLVVTLPVEIAFDRKWLDSIFEAMGKEIEKGSSYREVEKVLVNHKIISDNQAMKFRKSLSKTYNRVLDLHKKRWNGIWFRIVRNFFWSAVAGKFDLIIGNPPWVRWSNLPLTYRKRIKSTCEEYEIFSSTPFHGGNELDISGMITYTVADKWLKQDALLGFVITQSHFQAPSSEGFRKFKINNEECLKPVWVEDLKALKPFRDAVNKTCLALLKKSKNEQISYPVDYYIWSAKKNYTKSLPEEATKEEITKRVIIEQWEANPVGVAGSPWAILPIGKFESLKDISVPSTWCQRKKGITADLNGVYFVTITGINQSKNLIQIENRPEAGKNDIGPKRKFWIEPNMIYPLLKGSGDFKAYELKPKRKLYTLLPNLGITRSKYEEASVLLDRNLPLTRAYFETYQELLKNRSTYRTRMSNAPYFVVYNVGDYTLAPYKVIWAEQSDTFKSCVASSSEIPLLGDRCWVPDHKIFFVDCINEYEAHYICALLNNKMVAEFLYSHNISIQVGNIFKYLNLPKYSADDFRHIEIAKASIAAHNLDGEEKETKILECEVLSNKVF